MDILAHVTLSSGNLCEARDIWVFYANAAGELLVRFSEDEDGERGGSPTRFRLYDHFVRRRSEMPSVDGAAWRSG